MSENLNPKNTASREYELQLLRAELARKDELIGALIRGVDELEEAQADVMDSGYYTGPGDYPPTPEEEKYFARLNAARANLVELREAAMQPEPNQQNAKTRTDNRRDRD